MQKIAFILLLFTFSNLLFAQNIKQIENRNPLNSIDINFLGDASILSLNYSRIIRTPTDIFINTKLGIGYQETFELCLWGGCDTPEKLITIPHHITGNLGRKRSFLELGIGGTLLYGKDYQNYVLYPIIAYRFIPFKLYRVNFRIYAHYVFYRSNNESGLVLIPAGISVGLSF
ncbi:MAG: hypothetical protein PF448_03850 [Bacteroidales bacterium]|jgi:hypothetical protein|nr:hypothetical protein [Bacteroidales bacterium]